MSESQYKTIHRSPIVGSMVQDNQGNTRLKIRQWQGPPRYSTPLKPKQVKAYLELMKLELV